MTTDTFNNTVSIEPLASGEMTAWRECGITEIEIELITELGGYDRIRSAGHKIDAVYEPLVRAAESRSRQLREQFIQSGWKARYGYFDRTVADIALNIKIVRSYRSRYEMEQGNFFDFRLNVVEMRSGRCANITIDNDMTKPLAIMMEHITALCQQFAHATRVETDQMDQASVNGSTLAP